MQWIFRFLGKVPRGKFEYTCGLCGNYEVLNIPEKLKLNEPVAFYCKCRAIICIWEQLDHWHLKIIKKEN